jgi:hypothetical protein
MWLTELPWPGPGCIQLRHHQLTQHMKGFAA